jgi:hypothetical protein
MSLSPEFQPIVDDWKNEDLYNDLLHSRFTKYVNELTFLKEHRDWVEANQFGFGDRAFHYLWRILVHEMPKDFAMLEVGVFKGQTISLVALLAKVMEKNAIVFGITTLQPTPDERCKYPVGDYASWIKQIHDQFKLPQPELIVGRSDEPRVISLARVHQYDMVYIDGGHDYKDVIADISNYADTVKVGGFLVMDDASIGRLNVGSCWSGLEAVALAVATTLDKDPRFKFLLAVGHINVFQRIQP